MDIEEAEATLNRVIESNEDMAAVLSYNLRWIIGATDRLVGRAEWLNDGDLYKEEARQSVEAIEALIKASGLLQSIAGEVEFEGDEDYEAALQVVIAPWRGAYYRGM